MCVHTYTYSRDPQGRVPLDPKNCMYLRWHEAGIHLALAVIKQSHMRAFN